jgi:hypothetical protein
MNCTFFTFFPHLKIEVCLKFEGVFISLQTVHGVAWKKPNINSSRVSHQATKSHPHTFNCESTPHFQFSHCLTFLPFSCIQFSISSYLWKSISLMMLHSSEKLPCAKKLGNCAAGRKHTVSDVHVHHWQYIKTKLFSYLTNRKSFCKHRK